MIVLVNPRATRAEHRRFPLSLMALGAALPPEVDWAIVDGNRPDADVVAEVAANVASRGASDPVSLFAVSVMPGPQLAEAVSVTRRLKAQFPRIPVAWGGYFPSLYPMPTLAAPYVDWIVRGQGEQTLVELLEVLRERRDPATVGRARLSRARRATPQPRTAMGRPRRTAATAVRADRRGRLPAPDRPRPPVGRLPGLDWLSVRVQLLRRDGRVRPARALRVARAHCPPSRASRRASWHGWPPLLRQQLLHGRAACGGSCADAWPRSGSAGGAKRRWTSCSDYADATWRRHARVRAADDVLRRRIRIRRLARADEEGALDGQDAGGRAPRPASRDRARILLHPRRPRRPGRRDADDARNSCGG